MNSEAIIEEYKARFKKIEKHRGDLLDDFKPAHIHNFRVEIKKLRAFLRLVNITSSEGKQKITKSVKKFYHAVGDIRNLQLHHQRLNGLCEDLLIKKPADYLEYLRQNEKQKKEQAEKLKDEISFEDFEKQLKEDVPKELSSDDKIVFVKNYHSRLLQLLALPIYFDETFHDIRKTLKDLAYNYEFIEDAVCMVMPPTLNNLKTIDALTASLGNFHDIYTALVFLNSISFSNDWKNNETFSIAELVAHLNLRKERMKKEILTQLQPIKLQF